MARADILVDLIRNGVEGDQAQFRKTARALMEDEASNKRIAVAKQIEEVLSGASNTLNGRGGGGQNRLPPGIRGAVAEVIPERSLNDLILSDSVHEQIDELIQEHRCADMLAKYNLEPRHKMIFYGPPGNGKTSLAEALAFEMNVPLFVLRYEDLIQSYLGKTAKNLSVVFDHVKAQKCVLFLDEFEAISKERSDDQDMGEIKRIVSSLLTQMDRLPAHVVLVSATNHSTLIDSAFWRRFQLHIQLEKPNHAMISRWLESYSASSGLEFGYSNAELAAELDGYSFSEVESFSLDVTRKYVLSMPHAETTLRKMVDARLPEWKRRLSA